MVGVTLFGLCVAGVLAGYLMQREMLEARIDQTKAIVEMARNMAAGLKRQVDAGELTKEAAIAEFGRRANSMTYDKGTGYLFGTTYDAITVLSPDPKLIGTNRMDVVTNGRKLSREIMDGVKANGEIQLTYEYVKPGEQKPVRKIGYAVAVPGFDMYLGTGAYLDDLDTKLSPIAWLLGACHSRHRRGCRRYRLDHRPQHLQAARPARRPHAGAGRRLAGRRHPGGRPRRRGRRDGRNGTNLQG